MAKKKKTTHICTLLNRTKNPTSVGVSMSDIAFFISIFIFPSSRTEEVMINNGAATALYFIGTVERFSPPN